MSKVRPRLEKILVLHGQALLDAIRQREPTSHEAKLSNKSLILRFADMDPTYGKSRTQWLIQTYIQDEHFKLEDLGRAYEALATFERLKRKLSLGQRELSRCRELQDLELLINPFVEIEQQTKLNRDLSTATGREKRRFEEAKARDESILLQEGEGLATIAVPMTEFAAKWWGRGTKWCTAAEKNNAFAQYHKDAPLVILVCPDGTKYQAHVTQTSIQFMDAMDKIIDEEEIVLRWVELKTLLYWMIQQNGEVLYYLPEECITFELCSLAIQQNGHLLGYVPEEYRNPKLCSMAVQKNGLAIHYILKTQRTLELCKFAVHQNGNALEYVPKPYKTPTLCQLAVQQDGLALYYVPKKYKTLELCSLAVQQNGLALQFVPKKFKNLTLYYLAVQQEGEALGDVPEKDRSFELCRLAVKQNGYSLRDIPKKNKTHDLCHLAVQRHGLALQYVPEEFKTLELCRLSVVQDGLALQFVPEDKRTFAICCLAVHQDGWALKYVPEDYKILELYQLAIEQNGLVIECVPENKRTPEFLACILPVQHTWHPDILQGLGHFPQFVKDTIL
jgi:Domain of unknown function (DUF4116)